MKRWLLCLPLLAACSSRAPSVTTVVSQPVRGVLAPFSDTEGRPEEDLLKLAGLALRTGVTLGSIAAESCWEKESARPKVREACLLLWSAGEEPSASLEEALSSGQGRASAIAQVIRRTPFRAMSFGALVSALEALKEDPLWLRAGAVSLWVSFHGAPEIREGETLISYITPTGREGPRSLASAMKAVWSVRPGAWHQALRLYCDPAALGETRLRCWKAVAAMSAENGLPDFFRVYLPKVGEADWTLFTRSFPQLAERIESSLRR